MFLLYNDRSVLLQLSSCFVFPAVEMRRWILPQLVTVNEERTPTDSIRTLYARR